MVMVWYEIGDLSYIVRECIGDEKVYKVGVMGEEFERVLLSATKHFQGGSMWHPSQGSSIN